MNYKVNIDMVANIGGEVKNIKESFDFSKAISAVCFAIGYAEAMNWACPMIHDVTYNVGYKWWQKGGNDVIKVVNEDGIIVKPQDIIKVG